MPAAAVHDDALAQRFDASIGSFEEHVGAVEHGPRFYGQPTCHHAPETYGGIAETEVSGRSQVPAFGSLVCALPM